MTKTTVKQGKSVRSSDIPSQQLKQHLAASGGRQVAHSPPFLALHSPHLTTGECFSRHVVQGGGFGFEATPFYEKNDIAIKLYFVLFKHYQGYLKQENIYLTTFLTVHCSPPHHSYLCHLTEWLICNLFINQARV